MAKSPRKSQPKRQAPTLENGKVSSSQAAGRPQARRSRATPGSPLPPRRVANAERRAREHLTPDEVEKLLAAAGKAGRHGQRDRTLLLLAYRHGLRVSELVALRWDQVELKAGILHELLDKTAINDPAQLATAIKALPITLQATRPIDEAISSAGGVLFEVLNAGHMLEQLPGVFCAGEMLDWEAPTGGYLLHASFATGRAAGQGVLEWLRHNAA